MFSPVVHESVSVLQEGEGVCRTPHGLCGSGCSWAESVPSVLPKAHPGAAAAPPDRAGSQRVCRGDEIPADFC